MTFVQAFEIENPLGVSTIQDLFNTLSSRILEIVIPIAVLMYVYAGVYFLIAAGDPKKIARAKEIMLYTTIGLLVIFIGGGFVSLIKSIINAGQ